MIATSKKARALMIRDRLEREAKAQMRALESDYTLYRQAAFEAARDRDEARQRIREALPVYVRAQELERYMGRTYAFTVAFDPACIWRASFEHNLRHRERDVYELDSHVRYMAQDAAEKIHHTIMEEVRKQTGIPGGPHGRF